MMNAFTDLNKTIKFLVRISTHIALLKYLADVQLYFLGILQMQNVENLSNNVNITEIIDLPDDHSHLTII